MILYIMNIQYVTITTAYLRQCLRYFGLFSSLFLVSFLGSTLLVEAESVSDSFIVQTQVDADTTPPTVPDPVSATPIASNQIDIDWGTSTDNTVLGGYQLFRDGAHIATTTLTSYSDTGLSANTTYTYTVTAFDIFNNISSSSVAAATTTFAAPAVPPSSSDRQTGSRMRPLLSDLHITPGAESAVFVFSTNVPVRFTLRYGQGSVFNGGIIESSRFAAAHETLLPDLQPDTRYEYELHGLDRFGISVLLRSGHFTTLAEPDLKPPPNISGFTAHAIGADVLLSWGVPIDPDFAYVRVVRNHFFFPTDPNDGIVVYEGRAVEFTDQGALAAHATQYYTLFAYDGSGKRSSGAIAFARRAGAPSAVVPDEPDLDPDGDTATTTAVKQVGLADIEVVQADEVWRLSGRGVAVDGSQPFTVRAAYDLFPRHLKAITVTLSLPDNPSRVFSFMLRANDDFTYYEATIAPLGQGGVYGFGLSVFDMRLNTVVGLEGTLPVAVPVTTPSAPAASPAPAFPTFFLVLLGLVLVGIGIVGFWWFIAWRRDDEEDNEDNSTVES